MQQVKGIIDSHIHILPAGRTASLVRWIRRSFPSHPSRENMSPEDIIGDIRACGVEKAFNFVFPLEVDETDSLNLFSRDIARKFDMLVPFGSMHAGTPRKDEVTERCIEEYGLAGIKLHPYAQRFEAFSPEFEPMYRTLDELGRPFFVHTGFDAFYGMEQDLDYLRRILDRYPGMPVVLVHSLFPRFALAYSLLAEYPHAYVDMTNVPGTIGLYAQLPEAVRDNMDAFGDEPVELDEFRAILTDFSDRVMFGTDHPAGMGTPEEIYRDLDGLGLDADVRENLLRNSAAAFLADHCA
ncbi:MAG TPA: amidohydrolase family protein [Candidatus Anoxymicrobiaceae bacterium]